MREKCVYHYCSVNTFFSIISNQTLRLSDITKSNDRLEIRWAVDIIKEIFIEQYGNLHSDVQTVISKDKYTDIIYEKVNVFFEQNELRDKFFVICFSGEDSGDLLSQWRGYGDDGKGIAIGVSERILKKFGSSIQIYEKQESYILYSKVIYDREKQKEKLKEVVIYFLDKMNNLTIDDGLGVRNKLESVLIECLPRLYQEALFMKNPFFKEENESRLVICVGKDGENPESSSVIISQKKFYIRDNQLVSCYEIYIDDDKEIKEKMISKLILGPKCQLDNNTLLNFMREKNFKMTKESIYRSKGSYQ